MKQAALMALGMLILVVIAVSFICLLGIAGTKITDTIPQPPPLRLYATNTWVAERRAETMTATYRVYSQ